MVLVLLSEQNLDLDFIFCSLVEADIRIITLKGEHYFIKGSIVMEIFYRINTFFQS